MTDRARKGDSTRTEEDAATVALSTRELNTDEGRTRWVDTLEQTYCEMDVAWPEPERHFDAEWGGRPFGDLHVSTVRADPHTVVRSPAMIESDSDGDYLLCIVTEGRAEVRQSGRATKLDHGSFAVIDCATPFVFHSPTEFEQVVVRAPRELLTSRLPRRTIDSLTARAIPGRSGAGSLVSHLLLDIAAMDAQLPTGSAVSFSSSALDMLVTAFAEGPIPISGTELNHAQDLARVQHAIEKHLHDPDHSLSDIAAELGMSVRYIQKLFSTSGLTPHAWLYRVRLERARKYLLATDLTVADISERVGFRDVSHFSRTFRSRFGVSPGQYRKGRDEHPLHPDPGRR